jgi:hypothetical protein
MTAVVLGGCGATVETDAIDGGFGIAWTAVRMHIEVEGEDTEQLTISTVVDYCTAYQRLIDALDELQEAADDADEDDYCEDLAEPVEEFAAAAEAAGPEGSRAIHAYVADGEFDDDDYEFGEDASGSMVAINEDRAAPFRDWDEDEDPEDNCGLDEDDMEDLGEDNEYFRLEGDLEIASVEDEGPMSGTLDAQAIDEDEDDDDAGDVTATFTATYCEIDVP